MQTLTFNTLDHSTSLELENNSLDTRFSFDNVTTVTVRQDGFYEIFRKSRQGNAIPVARVPIANTNMILIN